MEAQNEQLYPLVKLVLEQTLEPKLVRVQALQVQVLVRVQLELRMQLEPLVQARVQLEPLVQAQLELLVQAQQQVPLELEQRRQRSCPKPQLHRHRCKVPDRSREPQRELRQTQVHPKASDMTPLALVQRELQVLEQAQVQEPAPELRVSLERLPLRQGLTQHI